MAQSDSTPTMNGSHESSERSEPPRSPSTANALPSGAESMTATSHSRAASPPELHRLDTRMENATSEGMSSVLAQKGSVDSERTEDHEDQEEEEEEEEFRYEASPTSSVAKAPVRITSLSPSSSSASQASPQSSIKSPYSKWDPRHERYLQSHAAPSSEAPLSLKSAQPASSSPGSTFSSPVLVSAPESPVVARQRHTSATKTEEEGTPVLVDLRQERGQDLLDKLASFMPQPAAAMTIAAGDSTVQSAIKAFEARVQKPTVTQHKGPVSSQLGAAAHLPHSPVQLLHPDQPQQDKATSDATSTSYTECTISEQSTRPLSHERSEEADPTVADLKSELRAAQDRAKHLEARLHDERIARGELEDERDRLKQIAKSLRSSSEQAAQEKHAREVAERELVQLRTSLQERDKELEECRTVMANRQREIDRLEAERTEAIREIVRTEDEMNGRILEDGNELIELREQIVALLMGRKELEEEVEQLAEERDAAVGRAEEAEEDLKCLKTAMIRVRAEFTAQLQAKDAEVEATKQEAEKARAGARPPSIQDLAPQLHKFVQRADTATEALHRHVQADMLDLGPIAPAAGDSERGILSRAQLLQLVEHCDTIFSTRSKLVIPPSFNTALSTGTPEQQDTPLQQLNKASPGKCG
ncbi:hypothetical protein JCM10908_006078 [Rhodotorula pacifica]|uniref:uncharacterized protein n=1 Tax=Rhodotorula pacifica TaxID=1495444 RepID=UPI00316D8B6D